jgi:hypothetical protein
LQTEYDCGSQQKKKKKKCNAASITRARMPMKTILVIT